MNCWRSECAGKVETQSFLLPSRLPPLTRPARFVAVAMGLETNKINGLQARKYNWERIIMPMPTSSSYLIFFYSLYEVKHESL